MAVATCSVPLLDWTGDKLSELIQDQAHIHPAQKLCAGAAQVSSSVARRDRSAVATHSPLSPFTFNMEVPAMSKPKTAITSPAVDIETDADSPQRWTAKRKAALVIDILQGKTTAAEAARQHALTLAEVEQWSRTQ